MIELKKQIKRLIYNDHLELSKYYSFNLKSFVWFLYDKLFYYRFKDIEIIHLNFLVTSNAELRVFKPIINYLLNNNRYKMEIFYLSKFRFEKEMYLRIKNSENAKLATSVYSIIKSFNRVNYLNLICLDHAMYKKHHALGIKIIGYIKKNKGKTVCLQHGGTQFDYIKGQSTSESKYQIIFGEYIYNRLLPNKETDKNNVFLTGNPLHDDIFIQKKKCLNKFSFKHLGNRKIITLITCLHTEYEYRDDSKKCYIDYINKIYSSIDFKKYYLVVNMHPNDSFNPNIYENQLMKLKINKSNVSIIKPNEFNYTIYDFMNISDLIISRSSTIIEEGLLLQKKIIAFDLFEDGPSKYYKHLEVYNTYKRIIGVETNLTEVIDKSINEVISSSINQKKIEQDFTYRFDGNSTKRIINAFKEIKEQELNDLN